MKHALIQMHLAVLLWGFTGVLGRAISLDAPVLVWYRMGLTALIMIFILYLRRQWAPVGRRDMLQLVMIGCLMGLHWVAFYGAVKFANASIAMVCLSTAGIFVTLLDPLFNKSRYNLGELLLCLLAICGVFLIYSFQTFYAKGILWGVIAAALSAIFTMLNKRIANKYPARTMVFYEMSSGWVFISLMLAAIIGTGSEKFWIGPENTSGMLHLLPLSSDWIWLILLSLCCTVWAQSLALNALKRLSAFTAVLSVNLEPVYGILLAFIFFRENEELHLGFYLGMAMICLSVVAQTLRITKKPKT
jgi:drug/metabolite transporter (DMT)-like permease